jgi:two-component system, cell cycle sensor histidine kinase and response regulator CckA
MRQANPDNSAGRVSDEAGSSRSSLVERAPFGICRSSLSRDRFTSVNPAFCRMLGYSEEELLGMHISERLYSDAPNRFELMELLVRDHRFNAQEISLRRKDGSLARVRVTAYLTRNQRGDLDDVESYFEDLTEQSALEQQIRAVQKLEAVGRLAGGVAHDFNNILVVIKLSTDMMLGQVTPENLLTRSLLQVSHAADRAASLTKQMLAFSRRQVMQARVVNINSVVSDTLHMLRRIIGEDVQLVTKLAEHLSNTRLDPDQLSQIVFNLAVNARDAMPKGGTLEIETADVELDEVYAKTHPPVQPGSYVVLSVSDSGSGIAKDDLPRIFEPFFTTKEMGKGTGLGLAIVYGIVKQSGGYIWVYSEPGLGTTFKLYFPVTMSRLGAEPHKMAVAEQPSGETILIVEDDDAIRANVRDCLQHLGYTVLEAASGQAALEICECHNGKIDLMMTDLVMPGLSGRETAARVAVCYPEIRLMYTSGYTEDGAARRDLTTDGTTFLEKPYTVADLARTVRRALFARPGAGGRAEVGSSQGPDPVAGTCQNYCR